MTMKPPAGLGGPRLAASASAAKPAHAYPPRGKPAALTPATGRPKPVKPMGFMGALQGLMNRKA